ncbi:hypothetical protein CG397_00220 [Gardnerella vaginalis]|nr:hypothetical protein CG397_00220 [Gardnerella vaginalis]
MILLVARLRCSITTLRFSFCVISYYDVARGLSISLLASDARLYGYLWNVNILRLQVGAIYCS